MLTVMTYNIEFGGRGQEDALLAVMRHCQADIIGLTEADDEGVVQWLAKKLDMHHIWAKGSGDRHIATLSRYPIERWCIYNRSPLTQAVLETKINTPSGPLTIYNLHLIHTLLLPHEVHRWRAMGALLQMIKLTKPGSHLLLGDFNAIAPGDRVLQHKNPVSMQKLMRRQLGIVFKLAIPRLLKAGYIDCFRQLHPQDDGFTWFTRQERTTRYDYIFAPPSVAPRLKTCRVVDDHPDLAIASDHYPLLAQFEC